MWNPVTVDNQFSNITLGIVGLFSRKRLFNNTPWTFTFRGVWCVMGGEVF